MSRFKFKKNEMNILGDSDSRVDSSSRYAYVLGMQCYLICAGSCKFGLRLFDQEISLTWKIKFISLK